MGVSRCFHRDHLKYILAAKAQCRRLVVGITNPDPTLTREDSADRNRSSALANPLSYYERMLMVEATLLEAGLLHTEFLVTPLPINMPELFKYYVPLNATFFLTIYDAWGRRKQERLQSIGLRTVVLWERPETEKAIQGTDVRRLIAAANPWGRCCLQRWSLWSSNGICRKGCGNWLKQWTRRTRTGLTCRRPSRRRLRRREFPPDCGLFSWPCTILVRDAHHVVH